MTPGNRPFANQLGYNRASRLAEIAELGKRPARAQLTLLLDFTLLFAGPILQTTIHLRPLTVPRWISSMVLDTLQMARDEHSVFDIAYWPDVFILPKLEEAFMRPSFSRSSLILMA